MLPWLTATVPDSVSVEPAGRKRSRASLFKTRPDAAGIFSDRRCFQLRRVDFSNSLYITTTRQSSGRKVTAAGQMGHNVITAADPAVGCNIIGKCKFMIELASARPQLTEIGAWLYPTRITSEELSGLQTPPDAASLVPLTALCRAAFADRMSLHAHLRRIGAIVHRSTPMATDRANTTEEEERVSSPPQRSHRCIVRLVDESTQVEVLRAMLAVVEAELPSAYYRDAECAWSGARSPASPDPECPKPLPFVVFDPAQLRRALGSGVHPAVLHSVLGRFTVAWPSTSSASAVRLQPHSETGDDDGSSSSRAPCQPLICLNLRICAAVLFTHWLRTSGALGGVTRILSRRDALDQFNSQFPILRWQPTLATASLSSTSGSAAAAAPFIVAEAFSLRHVLGYVVEDPVVAATTGAAATNVASSRSKGPQDADAADTVVTRFLECRHDQLDYDPVVRLRQMFRLKPRWHRSELEAYFTMRLAAAVGDSVAPFDEATTSMVPEQGLSTKETAALIVKYCREHRGAPGTESTFSLL